MRSQKNSGYQARHAESPPNSYSRQLDQMVSKGEPPYGYSDTPPLMGTENQEALENIRLQKMKNIRYS